MLCLVTLIWPTKLYENFRVNRIYILRHFWSHNPCPNFKYPYCSGLAPYTKSNTDNVRALTKAVSRRPLTAEALVRARVSPCVICGRQRGTETGFFSEFLGLPRQYHSTVNLHAHISSWDEQ
jgi:hypothetical protein